MKLRLTTLLLGLILLVNFEGRSNSLYSIDDLPKYGEDSVECMKTLSLYKEFVKQKNYIDAHTPWMKAFTMCPKATKSIYSDGVKIIRFKIKDEKDAALKDKWVDTLMMVYDKRIEFFGDDKKYPEGWILGRKGSDLGKYRKGSEEEAYQYLSKSLELRQNKTEAAVLAKLLQTSARLLKIEKVTKEDVITIYTKSIDIIENQIEVKKTKGKKTVNLEKAQESIDNLFGNSTAAECKNIIPIFTSKFEANPEDVKLLTNIVKLLDKKDCTDSKLFASASEKLHSIEPSAASASALAKLFFRNKSYQKAVDYYNEAISLEQDNNKKGNLYFEMGGITGIIMKQYSKARGYAYEAAKLLPSSGKPYILIAKLYAISSKDCGETEFEHKAVYWAAVDKLIKAKSIDAEVAEEAKKLINTYSAQFPGKETGFFHNVTEGSNYKVECWINESTKARYLR